MMTPADALTWWMAHHYQRTDLAAIAAGVSICTVRRWKRLGAVPPHACALIDQVAHGTALCGRLSEGRSAVRWDWRPDLEEAVIEAHRRRCKARDAESKRRGRIWTRNRAFRAGFKLPVR
ncbi:MAG: hypothetical protein JWQ90_2563 [Hydrocarboniphaga sp.]|nr:hypothetical protein [Hydrocarboniphaga sp.]